MTRTTSDLEFPIALLAFVPLLVVRFGIGYVRVKARRRRGVRAFRKTLIRSGMPRAFAKRFAEDYESFGSIRRYLPRLPFIG